MAAAAALVAIAAGGVRLGQALLGGRGSGGTPLASGQAAVRMGLRPSELHQSGMQQSGLARHTVEQLEGEVPPGVEGGGGVPAGGEGEEQVEWWKGLAAADGQWCCSMLCGRWG